MENDEFIQKLKERYANGEISRETYEDILSRYEKNVHERNEKSTDNEEPGDEDEDKAEHGVPSDYECAGSCTMGAGTYRKVSIAGSAEITGNVKAERISVAGSMHARGNIYAEQFKSAGSSHIGGILKAEEISVGGTLTCKEVHGTRIDVGGFLTAEFMHGENMRIEGTVKCQKIKGNALRVRLASRSKVKEIECESIDIKSKQSWWKKCRGWLYAGKITGEKVELDCVRADEVNGEDVKIGEHCEIGTVIGETVKIDKNAKVGRVVRK